MNSYDVVIAGGGLAGQCLARQLRLAHANLRLAVIEKAALPYPTAAHKVGESSVEIGAHYFARKLKLADHIAKDQLPKYGLRFFFGHDDNRQIGDRLELGVSETYPTPSYQFDRGILENHLVTLNRDAGIDVFDGTRVTGINTSEVEHQITAIHKGQERLFKTKWFIDAAGRAALLKRKLGWQQSNNHDIHAVWFRVADRVKIDDWCSDPEWIARCKSPGSRWLSTNHLMGNGYWVWLIPLSSGSTSVGIVADSNMHALADMNSHDRALAWLNAFEPQCAQALKHLPPQDFLALKHFSHGSMNVFSVDRLAVTGEAGAFLDPFYSPGSDFIALSNTLIADLVDRDIKGESILARTQVYDQIYLGLVDATLPVYLHQYPIFGHHQVMPAKIVWDYISYWSTVGFLYFWERLTDMSFLARNKQKLKQAAELNVAMQEDFRKWATAMPQTQRTTFVDQFAIPLLAELNTHLSEYDPQANAEERFERNICIMNDAAAEIRAAFDGQIMDPEGMLTRVLQDILGKRQIATLT